MITAAQYFGAKINSPECTPQILYNADKLLLAVNGLLDEARNLGVYFDAVDADTGICISGAKGGSGDGGFRLSTSTTGSARSTHRSARGVDVYDPNSRLDDWLTTLDSAGGARNTMLEKHGLYRESPDFTVGGIPANDWCHLQDLAPGSGRRTYNP